jgi:hypothetical protein
LPSTISRSSGDDIAGIAGKERADGDDGAMRRRDIARHDRLDRHDDGGARHHRVDGQFGDAAMAALAGDLDLPIVDRGHHLAGVEVEFSLIEAGNVVQAEHGVDGEALEEPVPDHRRAALHRLLARLEDQPHGAVEVLRLRQMPGRAEQHCGVAVMAAQMRDAVDGRFIGKIIVFLDRQRVEIGTQANRPVAVADL